jgi:hypothetical protein
MVSKSKSKVLFTIRELCEILRSRQLNKYDINIGVSGKRGDGKSTFINKLLLRFDGFSPWKHQVYAQDDVIKLLREQKFGYCWDDEAINSGYKRDFQKSGQKKLIKIVSAYRSNYNLYISAIPFFYSLDKDLRDLIFMHIHIIERGLAVIFIQVEDQIHTLDPWDTRNNAKLEEKWLKAKQNNPNFRFPYHKLSTFAGYIIFNDLTDKQRKLYEEIREKKRAIAFNTEMENKEKKIKDFYENTLKLLIDKKLTKNGLVQACLINNKVYSSVCQELNRRLKDIGETQTVTDYFLQESIKEKHAEKHGELLKELEGLE